ncbi:LysR substrate binding domain-containing protein [Burkholderia sp. D7]|nr:LysR substrate binding domain-containing protein [Burkholderia sp. D7]
MLASRRRLLTSQPSLSRQIRDLEDEVGAPLFNRGARGVELTASGQAFLDHARLALSQVDTTTEAAGRAARPTKQVFALGSLTGPEMTCLPRAIQVLRDELANIDDTVSSDYSPDLAETLALGRLDIGFLRAESGFDLDYRVVSGGNLILLIPSDFRLTERVTMRPGDFASETFIAATNKAAVSKQTIKRYFQENGIDVYQSRQNEWLIPIWTPVWFMPPG